MNPKLTRLAELAAADSGDPMEHAPLTEPEASLIDALRAIRLTQAGSKEWNLARDSFYALTSGRKPPRAPHTTELARVARKWLATPTSTTPRTTARRLEHELHAALLAFMTGEGLTTPAEQDDLDRASLTALKGPVP